MPIYEYHCKSCQLVFEELILRSSDEKDLTCPGCGEKNLERLMSAFSASKDSGGCQDAASSFCAPGG